MNIKKYHGHQKKDVRFDRVSIPRSSRNQSEIFDEESSDGAYIFLPEWNDSQPHLFSKIDHDIVYEKG